MQGLRRFDQIDSRWLSEVLGEAVIEFSMATEESNWAQHAVIKATVEGGAVRNLWFKLCLHPRSGRSEVDYYLRDFVDLPNAPLVHCYDAGYEPGVGYHLLLADLSEDFHDRKVVPPTLEHGLALAEAVARMHRHYWETGTPKPESEWESHLAELRAGVEVVERVTGGVLSAKFEAHAKKLSKRWSRPEGQTLLHGDINPTNVLTPKTADSPVYFLDRQPLDGPTPYGLALYDLAYAITPWWPREFRSTHEGEILRCWFDTLDQPSYSWELAQADWALSVEQCFHIPLGHCATEESAEKWAWLWKWQLGNMLGEEIP
jgi:hypothetical protein